MNFGFGVQCELLAGNERHVQKFTVTIFKTNGPESEWEVFITGLDAIPVWLRDYLETWQFFKHTFGKQYSPEEDEKREQIFMETLEEIERHNEAYKRDWTEEERQNILGFRLPPNIDQLRANHTRIVEWKSEEPIPESIDWREKGYVTESEKDYPYEAAPKKHCRHKSRKTLLKDLHSVHYGAKSDEEQLKVLVAKYGPISVSFNIKDVDKHQQGVYYNPSCRPELIHAMIVVGYGYDEESELDYWLIKNSCGTDFGEGGYFKAARNKGSMCGVADHAVYVLCEGEEES
ncbi:papain family cysteine protease domain-containing protein [Ditylenchus destructor]|uniref:Papain family cysteine protease domain-containing protein n=1 Tax=Ditylenchus destructor TaxID=166010 RepID=A0AAD4QXZ6_9BILA|nr:papain family cysteine protease domain-containing protein [Ditylenchus destructor]